MFLQYVQLVALLIVNVKCMWIYFTRWFTRVKTIRLQWSEQGWPCTKLWLLLNNSRKVLCIAFSFHVYCRQISTHALKSISFSRADPHQSDRSIHNQTSGCQNHHRPCACHQGPCHHGRGSLLWGWVSISEHIQTFQQGWVYSAEKVILLCVFSDWPLRRNMMSWQMFIGSESKRHCVAIIGWFFRPCRVLLSRQWEAEGCQISLSRRMAAGPVVT